jgi:hypothetical protein
MKIRYLSLAVYIDINIYIYIYIYIYCIVIFFYIGFMAVIWELSLFFVILRIVVLWMFPVLQWKIFVTVLYLSYWLRRMMKVSIIVPDFASVSRHGNVFWPLPQRKHCSAMYRNIILTCDSCRTFYFLCLYQYCSVTTVYLVF